MFKRKLEEILSAFYRTLLFPFKKMSIERRTKSTIRQGAYLQGGTRLLGRNYIGRRTVLSHVTMGFCSYINSDGDLTDTVIGKYTSIGCGVRTELGSHPLDGHVALHPAFYSKSAAMGFSYAKEDTYEEFQYIDPKNRVQVLIGNDVWIGNGVRILGGTRIADGCAIGAGAVVTKDTEPYGIYAGVPAKLIRKRFDAEEIRALLEKKWWDWDETRMKEKIDRFADVKKFLHPEGNEYV